MQNPRYAGEQRNQPQGPTGKFARQREQEAAYKATVAAYHDRFARENNTVHENFRFTSRRSDVRDIREWAPGASVLYRDRTTGDTFRASDRPNHVPSTTNHRAFQDAFDAAMTITGNADDARTMVLRAAADAPAMWDAHRFGNQSGDDSGAASDIYADAVFRLADEIQRRSPAFSRSDALTAAHHQLQKTVLWENLRAAQQLV